MKSLELHSSHYRYLEKSYKEYLQILGYAEPTVKKWPEHIREFLHWLEQTNVEHITSVTVHHVNDFTTYIKRRKSHRKNGKCSASAVACGGGLSANHINTILNAVTVFTKFLNSTGKYFLDFKADREQIEAIERIILSVAEIKQLYEATFLPHRENTIAIGQRDRAIIAVFYGCGLRRSEGKALNISDVDLENKLLFVRKGKGNKQRYVPIANKHFEDIRSYLTEGREWFLYEHYSPAKWLKQYPEKKQNTDDTAFFISIFGNRMNDFYQRLEVMKKRAEINKAVTLHGLRHSIATHLLQSGMDIEEIAKFLGHSSLASTQIYTHIVNEYAKL